jgi:hypothetical protein
MRLTENYLRLSPNSLLFPAAIGLFHDRGIVYAQKSDGRLDVAFDSHSGALAGNAANNCHNPQFAGSVINLIDTFAQSAYGLGYLPCDGDLLVHVTPGIRIDFADLCALAGYEQEARDQRHAEIENSLSPHFAPYLFQKSLSRRGRAINLKARRVRIMGFGRIPRPSPCLSRVGEGFRASDFTPAPWKLVFARSEAPGLEILCCLFIPCGES